MKTKISLISKTRIIKTLQSSLLKIKSNNFHSISKSINTKQMNSFTNEKNQFYSTTSKSFSSGFIDKLGDDDDFKYQEEKSEAMNNYIKVINYTVELKQSFDLKKFLFCIEFLTHNVYFNNASIVKNIEHIYLVNLEKLDSKIQSKIITFLSQKVMLDMLPFEDHNWINISNEFFSQRNIPLEDFYNSITALDKLVKHLLKSNKKTNNAFEFPKKYSKFLSKESMNIFNTNVKITSVIDILLFSKLVHIKIINMSQVTDQVYMEINDIIVKNRMNLVLKSELIFPCIIVLHQEVVGVEKTQFIFQNAIKVINDHLVFTFSNYYLLESSDKEFLDKFSDNLFYYCHKFMSESCFETIFQKLVISYYNRVMKDQNINWLNEITMLQVISNKLEYRNAHFWDGIFSKIKLFLINDFEESIEKHFDQQPKKLGYEDSNLSSFSKNRKKATKDTGSEKDLALMNISGLFYIGIIIEIAAKNNINNRYWDFIISSLQRNINFKQRDLFFNIQFIYFYCKDVYSRPELRDVWTKLIKVFDPKLSKMFTDISIVEFFIDTIFRIKKMEPENLTYVLSSIFRLNEKDNEIDSSIESSIKESIRNTKTSRMKAKKILNKEQEEENNLNDIDYQEEDEDIMDLDDDDETIMNNNSINSLNGRKRKIKKKPSNKISNIELFCFIYELLDPILVSLPTNTCQIVMANIFVDLLRYENSFLVGTKIKVFTEKMKVRNLDSFKDNVANRLINIVQTETVDNSITKLVILLNKAKILSELDVCRIIFCIKKNNQSEDDSVYKTLNTLIKSNYSV